MPQPSRLNKYEILDRVGNGGMGILYRAHDPDLDRIVAVKVLRADFSVPDAEERFMREARALARLKHPGIVRIFDFGRADDQWFLVMEFIVGSTLAQLIDRRQPAALAVRLGLFDQICAAVAHAHDHGWIHRDLKPSNVMLDEEDQLVKVLDFGLARQIDVGLTQYAAIMGSPNYMAPEQVHGRPVDRRADVFAASALLYELLTFEKAFPGDTADEAMSAVLLRVPAPPSTRDAFVPAAVDAIVDRGLAKSPEDRFADMHAFRDALLPVLAAMPVDGGSDVRRAAAQTESMPRGDASRVEVTVVPTRVSRRVHARVRPIVGAAAAASVTAVLAATAPWNPSASQAGPLPVVGAPPLSRPEPAPREASPAASIVTAPAPGPQRPESRPEAGAVPTPTKNQAPSSQPPPSALDDRHAIAATLTRYAAGYNALDARRVASVMAKAPVDDLEQSFSRYASFAMTIEPMSFAVNGDTASVVCREARQFQNKTGERVALPPETVTYELRRRDGAWLIVRGVH